MITIRKYEEKDRENLLKICIETSSLPTEDKKDLDFLNLMYNDYYAVVEGHNCFVAADDDDNAIAYIICTENYDAYRKIFLEEYVPRLDENMVVWNFNAKQGAIGSTVLQEKYKEEYPAHLHIDVLPEYHRKGIGHMLVNTLKEHLHNKGICGVMLTVGSKNMVGRGFYDKYGFDFLEQVGDDVAYGLKTC